MNTENKMQNIRETSILVDRLEKKHPDGFIFIETNEDHAVVNYFAVDPSGKFSASHKRGVEIITRNNTRPFVDLLKGASAQAIKQLQEEAFARKRSNEFSATVITALVIVLLFLFYHYHTRGKKIELLEQRSDLYQKLYELEKKSHTPLENYYEQQP